MFNTPTTLTSLPFLRLLPRLANLVFTHTRPNRYILVIIDRVLETQVDGELEHGVAIGLDIDLFGNLDNDVSLPLSSRYEIGDGEGDVVLVVLGICSENDVSPGFVEVSECHDGGLRRGRWLGLGDRSRIKFKIQLVTRRCSVLVESATRHLIGIGILHVTSPMGEEESTPCL
jgi:hypothetical protein